MLVFGYELQDVLRVVVGIALGLLTVYRRELSCNRGYHPEGDENDDPLGDSEHQERLLRSERAQNASSLHEDEIPPRGLRRRNSSSALSSPGMLSSSLREHGDSVDSSTSKEDPTDELLESAGLFLSGGPFLAMAIAVFDHLVLTIYLGTFASVSSLVHRLRARVDPRNAATTESNTAVQPQPEGSTDQNEKSEEQKYVYSVAWNAATEYFTGISSKLDGGSSICNSEKGDEANVRRSQSTGNLLHLSDERSRELLSEMIAMAGRGSMDVTLLPSDAQIAIFSYLYPQDVLAFTLTNRAGRQLLDDTGSMNPAEEGENNHIHDNNGVTALLVWKCLFQRDYSWVLSSWEIGREAFLRSVDDYGNQESQQSQLQHQRQTAASTVVRHVASTIMDSEQARDLDIDSVLEALSSSTIHPSSMKEFYFTFTETWLNYTIAGCNSTDKCLIGLHGHVFEISDFVEDHPGSTETLLLQAGRDATVFFESMGHSLGARKLAVKMVVVVNAQCARWHFTGEEGSNSSGFELRHGAFGPLFSTWGLIQPSCKSLDRKRNIVGFLTPRKRSRPRFQGGLHRIRERMRREEESQQLHAQRWESGELGASGLFGGVHVYFDPFRGWRWWYTDRSFNTVFIAPQV